MSQHLYTAVEQIEDLKDKLTSKEYKDLLDTLMAANKDFQNKPRAVPRQQQSNQVQVAPLPIPIAIVDNNPQPVQVNQAAPQPVHIMEPLANYFNERNYIIGITNLDRTLDAINKMGSIRNITMSSFNLYLNHKIIMASASLAGLGTASEDLKLYWDNIKGCVDYNLPEREEYYNITLPRVKNILHIKFGTGYNSEKCQDDIILEEQLKNLRIQNPDPHNLRPENAHKNYSFCAIQ
jgi:hypothetical protein